MMFERVVNSPNQIREIRLFRVNRFDFIMFASEMGERVACEQLCGILLPLCSSSVSGFGW